MSRKFKLGLAGVQVEAEAATAVIAQEKPPIAEGLVSAIAGAASVKAEGTVTVPTASTPAGGHDTKRLEAVRNINVQPIALEQEDRIRADLNGLGVLDAQEQVDLLIKHLAMTQIGLRFEGTYRTIFGSQVELLKWLNTRGGSTKTELPGFYQMAKANFPNLYETYSFDQYLQYLRVNGLIAEHAPEHFVITLAGREFLKWITDQGVVDSKLF